MVLLKTRKPLSKEHKNNISIGVKRSLENMDVRIARINQLLKVTRNNPYKCGWINVLDKSIYYRSSYELEGLIFLDIHKEIIEYFEAETLRIPYINSLGVTKITVPDWLIKLKSGNKYLIEVKPTSKLKDVDTILKIDSTKKWALANNIKYCIWDTNIIFSLSSTTMCLEELLDATVTHQNGERYSLNSLVIKRIGEKLPNRLILQESIESKPTKINLCLCGCGNIIPRTSKYSRGHNRRNSKLPQSTKDLISSSLKGKVCKEETKIKLRNKHKNKKLSKDHCIKISLALKGRKKSRKAVDKMIATNIKDYASGKRIPWNKNKRYKQRKNRL